MLRECITEKKHARLSGYVWLPIYSPKQFAVIRVIGNALQQIKGGNNAEETKGDGSRVKIKENHG